MMKKVPAFLVAVVLMLAACGKGTLSIPEDAFQPKIAIQGVLIPGQVPQINVSRNFPVTSAVNPDAITITDADIVITDEVGSRFQLAYNPQTQQYEAPQLNVEFSKSYTLQASASVDGQALQANSTTTVPNAVFQILEQQSRLGSMGYRERDEQGELINFSIAFERAPGTGYYLVSIVALDADTANYIYENPFNENTAEDVQGDFEEYKYNYYWIQDRPLTPGVSTTEIASLYLFFYGRYRVIIYGADRNFRDFQTTHELLQGLDGNYHEPSFHISGDGIGVFGSAVADTAYFEIVRPENR